ncbi:hypothetical protein M9H77_19277 [Catharanthus roseus]|uniref:Uncharacterized protein n=1 Tax=Catharanthus roseus TaxID=4058 RepID=A0ACC0B9T6_CATRO|nr:hypothetical protein M9H77_19277 [Catharanthus roseus]
MKKVQTIIRWCMVSIGGTLGCTPSQHDIQATFPVQPSRRRPREHVTDRGARGVKRGARRHPGREQVLDALLYLLLHKGRNMSTPTQQWLRGMPTAPSSGFTAFQSPHPSAYGFGRFRAPPPPGTAGRILSAAGIVLGRKSSDSRHSTGLSCADIIFYFS